MMDFGTQIKNLRKKHHLTQEQLAQHLNVTRQAVSHWENNKNLPDIEILITLSNKFEISLDELIKGGQDMTQKIIQDGSETRRSHFNMITTCIGFALMLLGILLLFIKANSVEYIDANGFLHENFFLIPIAFLCFFSSFICFITIGLKTIIYKLKQTH